MNTKQEPQAQAEPESIATFSFRGFPGGPECITLQSHREAMAVVQSACLESVTAVRLAFEQTIAKKDAALDACVDALENIRDDYPAHDGKRWAIDAAVTQAQEART